MLIFTVLLFTYALGHFVYNSNQSDFVSIQPKPGKKSVRYKRSGLLRFTNPSFPLSFHADMHHKDGSFKSNGYVPRKYSKKSEAISKSSRNIIQMTEKNSFLLYRLLTFYYYNCTKIEIKKHLIESPFIMTGYFEVTFEFFFLR